MDFLARSEAEHVIVFSLGFPRITDGGLSINASQYILGSHRLATIWRSRNGETGDESRYVAGGASFQRSAAQRNCPSVQAEFAHVR